MTKKMCLLSAGGVLALVVMFLPPQDRTAVQARPDGDDNRSPAKGDVNATKTKRAADEAAIRKATSNFVNAVEKGDAKAVAGMWTEEGEYINDDGTKLRGRAAIEAAYARAFAASKKLKIEMTIESIRFPSKDTAIEEGYAKSFNRGSDQPTTSRYSVLHVREGGRWQMALLREWADDGDSPRDLDWLIGTWQAKGEDAEIRSTYEWDAKKNSIRCRFTIKGKDRNVTVTQILLKDPRDGKLHSWLFDDEGGFGEGAWARDGKRWVITATGVQPDGSEMSATNILTPLDKDTFTWQSTGRTLDGEEVESSPPVKVTRVK